MLVVAFWRWKQLPAHRLTMGQGQPQDTSVASIAETHAATPGQRYRSSYKPFAAIQASANHPAYDESVAASTAVDTPPEPPPIMFFVPGRLRPAHRELLLSRSLPQDGSFAPAVVDVAVGGRMGPTPFRKYYSPFIPVAPPPTDADAPPAQPDETFGNVPINLFRTRYLPWRALRGLLGTAAYDDSLSIAAQDADLGFIQKRLFRSPYAPWRALREAFNHPAFDDSVAASTAGADLGTIVRNYFRNRYAPWGMLRDVLGTAAFDEGAPLPIVVVPPIAVSGAQRTLRLLANDALIVGGQARNATVTGSFGADYIVARSASWLTDIQITNKTSTSFLATFSVPAPDVGGVLDWMVFG